MKNASRLNSSSKKTDLKILETSESLLDNSQKNRIKLSYYIRIHTLFQHWWNILKYTTLVYIYLFIASKVANPILKKALKINNFVGEENGLYKILGYSAVYLFAIVKGMTFCADGFVSSLLKTPFGQICYAINKSGVDDSFADKLVNKITEINENFKETFKKFGILNISEEIVGLTRTIVISGIAASSSNSNRSETKNIISNASKQLAAAANAASGYWTISFLVPIFYSFVMSVSVKKSIDEIMPMFDE